MRWILGLLVSTFLGATAAQAQPAILCAHYQAEWAKVSGGTNITAMNGVIETIPAACADLRARAISRRDEVATRPRHTTRPDTGAAETAATHTSG
jgi:hypothetical protein